MSESMEAVRVEGRRASALGQPIALSARSVLGSSPNRQEAQVHRSYQAPHFQALQQRGTSAARVFQLVHACHRAMKQPKIFRLAIWSLAALYRNRASYHTCRPQAMKNW